jgi:pantoate kinase
MMGDVVKMVREARYKGSFAPASITCIFSPNVSEDPLLSGSVGVGFTIDRGVVARPYKSGVRLNGEDINFPTVEYVLNAIEFDGVELSTNVPLGCGFGISGASAISTAFLSEKPALELFDLAHKAEVVNLTGLGDVVTQSFAGVVVRKNAKCPSRAIVERYTWRFQLDFLILDSIPTKEVISNEVTKRKIERSGKKWTKEFLRKPTMKNLFLCSKGFAKETGLIEFVDDVIEAVESKNGLASMVMLGKAVFALNGFDALKEFGVPFKSKINCCGVRRF